MSKTNNNNVSEKDLIDFQKTTIDEVMKRYNTLIDKQTSDSMSITVPQHMLKEFSKDSINDRFFRKLLCSLEFQNNNGTIEAYTYVIDGSREYHSDKMFSFKFIKSCNLVKDILVYNEKIRKSIHLVFIISKLNSPIVTTGDVDKYEGINFYDLVLVFIMNYILNSWERIYFNSNKEEHKSEKYETSSEQKSSFIKNRNLVKDFIENSIPETIEELKKNKIYQLFMNSDISTKDVEDLKNILVKLVKDVSPILPILESLMGSNNNNCKKDKNKNCGGTCERKSNW